MNGYTQADNWLWDYVMPKAKPNTFKIVSAVVRMTTGWHRKEAEITYREFHELTGIGSRTTLINAIDDALSEGFVIRNESGRSFIYGTNIVPINGTESVPTRYRNDTDDGTESVPINGTESVPPTSRPKERKYKENLNKDIQFPAELDSPEFAQVWFDWISHRRDKGDKDYTPLAIKSLLAEWAVRGEDRTINAIRHSMSRNWSSIHEPDSNGSGAKSEYAEEVNDAAGGFNI